MTTSLKRIIKDSTRNRKNLFWAATRVIIVETARRLLVRGSRKICRIMIVHHLIIPNHEFCQITILHSHLTSNSNSKGPKKAQVDLDKGLRVPWQTRKGTVPTTSKQKPKKWTERAISRILTGRRWRKLALSPTTNWSRRIIMWVVLVRGLVLVTLLSPRKLKWWVMITIFWQIRPQSR